MFSFTKRPEQTFKLGNREYKINLAFNVVIEAFGVLESEDLSNEDKVSKIFDLFIIDKFETDSVAIKGDIVSSIFQYINDGPYGKNDEEDSASSESDSALATSDYDYEQDAGAIYASFLNFYNIDLNKEIGVMHWDRFKALFDNLGSDTPIQKIRQYRSDDLTSYKDDAERAKFISNMQYYYRLDKQKENDGFAANASSIFDMMFENGK